MIQKAVFSYFNSDESYTNKCGFHKYSDFIFTTVLAILCASRHFKEVQFFSTTWGVELFKQFKLPITSYSAKLNSMKNVSRFFWAYGKLIAYCEQKKPFVHIDNDVFLWKPLPDYILNARLCFQSHEPFNAEGYKYYNKLKACWREAPVRPQVIVDNEVTDFAYNCGICGGSDLKFFKEWKKCSEGYIFAHENENLFYGDFAEMLIHQNLFHEQYFAASLIKKHNLRGEVKVLHENAMAINGDVPKENPKYTHLWGTTKKDDGKMAKVRMTLFYMDKVLFDRIDTFCRKNNI